MKEKAQHLWSVLRNRVRSAVTKIKRADSQASVLSHGLHLLRHLFLPNPLTYMTYVTKEQCLVSLDSIGHVNVHHADGRIQRRVKPTAPLCGLLYAGEVQLYVAWDHQQLNVLDLSFEPMSQSQVKQGVFCCVYEPESNQVLCGGCGGITVWTFGQGTRRLKCQMILSQDLTDHDSVTYIALGRTALLTQICFAACGSSIWEFSLSDGRLQRVTRNMHLRRITGLLYSEVLQLLISGSRDGDIKVWDKDMQLRAVYVGHTGPVTALALSSSGLIFYSGSEDETLRTWDLEIQEQVGEQHLAEKIRGFETFKGDQEFVVVYTSLGLVVWQVQDLYQLHTVMGTSVTNIIVYGGGRFPSRALCVCVDSAVRLLAASTGDVISTLLLDRNSRVKSAEYCMYRETVYVLLEQGDLLKANALKNPMRIVSMLKGGSEGLTPTCLTLYTCISDEERAYCQWRDVVDQRGLKRPGGKDRKYNPQNDQNRSIPIIGGEDGSLCVLDWFTNRTLCQVNAHHPEKVTCLISSPESSFVISAGSDFTVKVWRFFPYSEECFSPYMSFFCSQPIGHMCTLKSQLLVAFCDSSSATYSLVQYCLRTQTRMDHTPSDDHRDEITGLCSCPRLRLIASAGKDRMIRIWNEENQLLRTLCLSSEPESLAFRSDQGELLLGIHSHVYHIDLSKLLPNPYQLKIMCLEPSVVDTQPHIAVTEDVLLSLSSHDKRRLTEPHSAYSRRTVGSIRINEESKTRHVQTGEQSEEFARLKARDQELQLLQDGMLKPNKKRQSNKNNKREAMNKYMQLFYKEKPCVKIPDVDSFNSDAEQMMTNVLQVEDSALGRSLCRGGFFPDVAPIASAEALSRDIQAFLSCRSIPNSAVVQLFWPSKMLEKQHEVEHSLWRDILEHIPHIPQGTDQAQTPKIMLKEEIKYVEDVRDDVEEEQDEELRNAMAILQKITETEKISPPTEDTSRVLSPPLPEVKPKNTDLPRPKKTVHSRIPLLKPLPPKSPKKTVVIKEPVFDKPPVSPVPTQLDKPPTPCTYSPEVHTPVHKEREVISPPLPFFVQQFQAKDWFTTICPETEVHMMSEAGFESRLLQGVLYRDLPMRIEVLQALKILHQYGQLKDSMKTFQTLITVINQRSLNLKVSEDQEFVFSCLRFMNDLFRGHKDLVLELLVTCVLVHPSLRAPLVHFLWDLGLQDPHGFLLKEINTWDSWEPTENHRESLRQSVKEWLQNWTLKLQNFVGESLRSITLGAYDEGTRVKRHHMRGAGRLRDKPKKTQDQRSSDIDVNTMEVLNYFCEVQLEKEMQVAPPRQGGTVLALPPINSKRALMRLGETSAPFRRKYEDDAQLPPILQPLFPEIIHFIDLPLKKISLYPFSPVQDASDSQDNIRSLNQEVHKYFIQQRSFTHSYY